MSAAAGRVSVTSTRLWATASVGLTLASVALLPLTLASGGLASQAGGNGIFAWAIGIPSGAVGVLVARRLPANPLGWLLLAIASCLILSSDGGDYVLMAQTHHWLPASVVGLVLYELWTPGLLLLGLVILLFPDARLPRRWRWPLWLYLACYTVVAGATAAAVAIALASHGRVDENGGLAATDHPSGWLAAMTNPALLVSFALWLAFIGRQVVSWRRATGERRQQLKWLACGAGVAFGAVLVTALTASLNVSWLGLAWVGFAALPIGMGVGILKYRLYDIDRIISRTLAYVIVTAVLIGAYAGLVAATSAAAVTTAVLFRQPVAVAAATLAAAALFNPLRRRVQALVDRRFNRARYDADHTITAFSSRLQDAMELDHVRADLLAVVDGALEPAHATLWLSGDQR